MNKFCFAFTLLLCTLFAVWAFPQQTTGNIEGTVLDPSGAALAGAEVTATDEATGKSREATSDDIGVFRLIQLLPGDYTLAARAQGFRGVRLEHLTVRLASVTPVTIKLGVGSVQEVVTVSADQGAQVDTVSTEVGAIIGTKQIEQLALIGRNFLDLAQLEPGVQLRDGGSIDQTKNNFTVVSVQGRGGRATQIQWDGLSVVDFNAGGPVVNIGLDSVQEFQVAEASTNPAQSLASGGAVNVVGRRGSNDFHGSAFGFLRDGRFAANYGAARAPYDRNQVGGRFGGPIVRNKGFLFADVERTNTRDSFFADPSGFPSLQGFFAKPYKDTFATFRADGALTPNLSVFARISYSDSNGLSAGGGSFLDPFQVKQVTRTLATGATLTSTHWTHDFRFGYVRYGATLSQPPAGSVPLFTDSRSRPFTLQIDGGSRLAIGPNPFSPQFTAEATLQGKYDAGYIYKRHTLRFGVDLTHWKILPFFPVINSPVLGSQSNLSNSSNPLDFPLESIEIGNGQGYFNTPPVFDHPHGGFFTTRPALYVHDTWSLSRNVTVNYGLRWQYFSGQFNPDLKRPALLDQFQPGLSRNTTAPKTNFSPQAGIAWDPRGDGKTVIRASGGLYFEELTFDSFYSDSDSFIPSGISFNFGFLAPGFPLVDPRTGQPFAAGDPLATSFGFPNGTSGPVLAPLFGQPTGNVATQVGNLAALNKAATAQIFPNPNFPSFFQLGRQLSLANSQAAFPPNVTTPRTVQVTVGIQRQLHKGLTATAEYVKVHGMDFPLVVDRNHVGEAAASTFDPGLAAAAIATTNASFGCPNNASPASINCAIAGGAKILNYGNNGLGPGPSFQGFAFRGNNPNFGIMDFLEPIGVTDYNAMNLRLEGTLGAVRSKPFSWMQANTITATYTLSRLTLPFKPTSASINTDELVPQVGWDNNNPGKINGPSLLDRTNLLNFSTITEISRGFRVSTISHWFTALPQNTTLPVAFNGCDGGESEIFCTDLNGDGTTGDLLPTASGPGAFGRSLKGSGGINSGISAYNSKFAGQLTPAGQLLVSQSLFTTSQLQSLGAFTPTIPLAPKGQASLGSLLVTDVRVAWHHKFGERVELEPSFDAFNVFNRSQFDAPGNELAGDLTGTIGHINGTLPGQRTNITQRGSGTFELGARRTLQAGLRISF